MSTSRGSGLASGVLDGLMGWLLSAATLLGVISLGYLAYGILFSPDSLFGTGTRVSNTSVADFPLILRNLQLGRNGLLLASILICAALLIRYWGFYETGFVQLVIGAGLLFGMNYLLTTSAQPYSGQAKTQSSMVLASGFTISGLVFLACGGVHLLVHTVLFVVERQQRRPRAQMDVGQDAFSGRKMEKQDQFMGPCWSLPFCRDSQKRVCPILLSRKPCWRDGRGCYCDQNIVLMLSGDRGQRATGRSAQGFVSMQSIVSQRPKTLSEKRAQCLACPIYLHRQAQKYKVFAPTIVAAVAAFFLINVGKISEAYPAAMEGLGRSLRGFSFGSPGRAATEVPQWATDLAHQTAMQWIIVGVLAILMIGYLIHTLEWVLYKLGW